MRECSVPSCNRKHLAKGFCRMHYLRMYKHGSLEVKRLHGVSVVDRVLAKVKKEKNGCWIFSGCKSEKGYGMIKNGKTMSMSHRVMYESVKGPIPDGLEIDHLCKVRACVNPEHLEAVTHKENIRRGNSGCNWIDFKRNDKGQFIAIEKGFI